VVVQLLLPSQTEGCSLATLESYGLMICPLLNCIHNLTSLQSSSLVVVSSFTANLTSLEIRNCNFNEALLEWGLHRLTSLQRLYIMANVESFPEKMLPVSLTTLSISCFHNLKYMSSFQSLTSLTTLGIQECEKLTSFPKDGLPPSLLTLRVLNCPLLNEHCKKDQGREWFKIAHIPYVGIDGKFIYDENQ
jgi:hypothetical protein